MIALKHHTSKLSTYDDLESLHTFGFRGEALASLCALSQIHVVTARAVDAPKGHKLDFEVSGKLKGTSVVAAQRGTKVVVEKLFWNLPVRAKELEKNIKREYGKALGLLQAYACISTGVRFVVSNQMPKASKSVAFSTGINDSTRDNITNVFGTKTLHALVKLDLKLELQPTKPGISTQTARILSTRPDTASKDVTVQGHISRPVFGEGRQTPDRQFFFVNSRPCGLPQVAKAFNEVYKSFNVSQSPFIFANLMMDTHAYDVNVSPDKRTILLHDQSELLESLKAALVDLFEAQEQSVPHAKLPSAVQAKPPSYKQLTITKQPGIESESQPEADEDSTSPDTPHILRQISQEHVHDASQTAKLGGSASSNGRIPEREMPNFLSQRGPPERLVHNWNGRTTIDRDEIPFVKPKQRQVEQQTQPQPQSTPSAPVWTAFDRMRPPRTPSQIAEITIGDRTTSTVIGDGSPAYKRRRIHTPKNSLAPANGLRAFAMPGSQMEDDEEEVNNSEADEDEVNSQGGGEHGEDNGSNDKEVSDNDTLAEPAHTAHPEAVAPGHHVNDDEGPDQDESADQSIAGSDMQPEDDAGSADSLSNSDTEYLDEDAKKLHEQKKVARLIKEAENTAARPSADNIKRADQALKGTARSKYSVLHLSSSLLTSLEDIKQQVSILSKCETSPVLDNESSQNGDEAMGINDSETVDAEARLSLTVSKLDFAQMTIAGQFNLGFIIALRPNSDTGDEDLFIIDQHAADEKFNFERLTRSLALEPQRLAQPKQLYLTAVDEEIILNHPEALLTNGFVIKTDISGSAPVGERCKLMCLPMSKETTFDLSDLEELLHLLADHSNSSLTQYIPRPSKVRKMLAMRACRSSIMVGKTLTQTRMQKVVSNLGEMDKPWNCPHGRPTMRHLVGLKSWQAWDGVPLYEKEAGGLGGGSTNWGAWLKKKRRATGSEASIMEGDAASAEDSREATPDLPDEHYGSDDEQDVARDEEDTANEATNVNSTLNRVRESR